MSKSGLIQALEQQNLVLLKSIFKMLHFYDPKLSHFLQQKEQEVYGCFTRPEQSTHLFLKRTNNNPSHSEFCNQPSLNHLENQQFFHHNHLTSCKMSLKRDNTKTLLKTHQTLNSSKNIILNRFKQAKTFRCQPDIQCVCDKKTSQIMSKKVFPDFPVYNQIKERIQIAQKHEIHVGHHRPQHQQPHNISQIAWNPPKIHFQIESPRLTHQRCKSENQLFQNNTSQTDSKIDSSSKNFMSIVVDSRGDQENKNELNKSTFNQKHEKKLGSKLSLQTILTSDSSKASLIHIIDHHKVQDSLISIKSEATLNNTAHSFHSYVSNSKKLKKIEEVLEVQSLCDENEADSDKESIVVDRVDQKALIIEDDASGSETWRETQRRLIKVSKLLKSQSLDIL